MENIPHDNYCSCSVCEILRAEQEEYQNAWDVKAWRTACDITNDLIFILFCVGLVCFFCYLFIGKAGAQEVPQYSDIQIVNAIYMAEGGPSAKFAYGIRNVHYASVREARRICLRTIRHYRSKYENLPERGKQGFVEYVQSHYCPTTGTLSIAEKRLNRYWQKNVMYFLRKDRQ